METYLLESKGCITFIIFGGFQKQYSNMTVCKKEPRPDVIFLTI